MDNEQYIESGLSVGAVKYVDPNEIITEEEYNYIKNKVPELNGRVGTIEGEIEEINSSLDNKASTTKGLYDFVTDFGGVANDENFDNSPILKNAIDFLYSNGGGRIMFGIGIYEFKTPIEVEHMQGVILEGVSYSTKADKKGGIFNYSSTGYFLTINTTSRFSELRNLSFYSDTGSFFRTLGSATELQFSNLLIRNVITAFNIGKSAYVDFNNISILSILEGRADTDLITLGKDGRTEFMNFYSCNIGGGEGMEYTGNIVHVYDAHVSFHNCDFPNSRGHGLFMEGGNNGSRVDLFNCNFTRCKTAIDVYSNLGNCFLTIKDTRIGMECKDSEEIGIIGRREKSNVFTIISDKIRFRFINAEKAPEYLIKADIGVNGKSNFDYYYDNENSISGQCKVLVGNQYSVNNINFINKPNYINDTITADGVTKDFDFILSTNSPYASGHRPYIDVIINTFDKYYYVVNNENGGELKVTVKFETPPTKNMTVKIFRGNTCVNKA